VFHDGGTEGESLQVADAHHCQQLDFLIRVDFLADHFGADLLGQLKGTADALAIAERRVIDYDLDEIRSYCSDQQFIGEAGFEIIDG